MIIEALKDIYMICYKMWLYVIINENNITMFND